MMQKFMGNPQAFTQNRNHTKTKVGMAIMTLLLAVGLLFLMDIQPSYATVGTYVGATTTYKAVASIPATPVVKASSVSYTSIKVSWATVPGATGYKIYRATSSKGTYAYRGATASLSYISSGLTTGKYYYYKIIAYRILNGVTTNSRTSAVAYARPIPATPTVTFGAITASSAKITWTGIAGATKYQVYRATTPGGSYTLVNTAAATTRNVTSSDLAPGRTYYYKVRAYHLEGKTNVYGAFSSVKTVTTLAIYGPNLYKAGTDMPAGEYVIFGTGTVDIYSNSTGSLESIIAVKNYTNNIYITVASGQYLDFSSGYAYPVASAPLVPATSGKFSAGMYKVGRDIAPGEYILYSDGYGYFEVDSDSKLVLGSILKNDFAFNRTYITVEAGQYLYFDGTNGYSIAAAPALDTSSGTLGDGTYKAGPDIPPGEYTLTANVGGYYEITSDSSHNLSSIIANDLFGSATTINVTIAEGQYIKLHNCTITLPTV